MELRLTLLYRFGKEKYVEGIMAFERLSALFTLNKRRKTAGRMIDCETLIAPKLCPPEILKLKY